MGILSGKRQIEQDIQRRAGYNVNDTARALTQANEKVKFEVDQAYKSFRAGQDQNNLEFGDAELLRTEKDRFKVLNNENAIKIQVENNRQKMSKLTFESNRIKEIAINENRNLTRKELNDVNKLNTELRIGQISLQALSSQWERLDRKDESRATREFRKELIKEANSYKTSERKATQRFTKDLTKMKLKSAELIGLGKNERTIARQKTKEIQTAWDLVFKDMGNPTTDQGWQDYKDAFLQNLSPRLAGMSADAKMKIADAYINQAKKLSGTGPGNKQPRGRPAYRQVQK